MDKIMLQKKIKKIPKHIWILLAIVIVGIFLRTYHFRDWLFFGDDQVNDITAVERTVVGGNPWPILGPDMGNTPYRLGPMFYYWQIISAKIFGLRPEVMAYPDLFFSILTIPLLYFFLKKYFSKNISLALSGIWAVSFYAIKFSRFGWNPNSIPFFSLLFLLALHEFMVKKGKVHWMWSIILGICLGVGIQLHAILLFLFPAVTFFIFLFIMKNDWKDLGLWKKWGMVILVMLILNAGQIWGDAKNNWINSQYFFNSFIDRSGSGGNNLLKNLGMDADCHIQAEAHIVSSSGDKDNCQFSFYNLLGGTDTKKVLKGIETPSNLIGMFFQLLFVVFGYSILLYRFKKEKEFARKYFLGIIILYSFFYFLIMISAINEAPLRYFISIAFMPFILAGLLLDLFAQKFPKYNPAFMALVTVFLISANLASIAGAVKEFSAGTRSSYKYVILGEVDRMVDYIKKDTSQESAYLMGDRQYFSNFSKSFAYVAKMKGLTLNRAKSIAEVPSGAPIYYIREDDNKKSQSLIWDRKVINSRMIGQVAIYRLEN